jgi:hypothetical protein
MASGHERGVASIKRAAVKIVVGHGTPTWGFSTQ